MTDQVSTKLAALQSLIEGFHAVKGIRAWAAEENQTTKRAALDLISEIRGMVQGYDPSKLTIERKRFSTTQGEVLLTYDGQRIEQFGDDILLVDGEWIGRDDAFWHACAETRLQMDGRIA